MELSGCLCPRCSIRGRISFRFTRVNGSGNPRWAKPIHVPPTTGQSVWERRRMREHLGQERERETRVWYGAPRKGCWRIQRQNHSLKVRLRKSQTMAPGKDDGVKRVRFRCLLHVSGSVFGGPNGPACAERGEFLAEKGTESLRDRNRRVSHSPTCVNCTSSSSWILPTSRCASLRSHLGRRRRRRKSKRHVSSWSAVSVSI